MCRSFGGDEDREAGGQASLERVCSIATSMGTSQALVQPIYLS